MCRAVLVSGVVGSNRREMEAALEEAVRAYLRRAEEESTLGTSTSAGGAGGTFIAYTQII